MIEKIKHYLDEKNLAQQLNLTEPIEVTFLAQGEYNQNYLLSSGTKQYVFRLNYGSQLHLTNQISYEYQALKWLEKSGRTPRVYYVDDSKTFFEQGLLIMAFLTGRPLDYRQDLNEAATIFSQIHGLAIDELAQSHFISEKKNILSARVKECEQLLTPVFASTVISNSVKKLFEQSWLSCEKQQGQQQFFIDLDLWRVNNTEVNSHNFIMGDQGYLIDWEKPVISHPVQDISQFLASTTTLWRSDYRLTQTEKQHFLARYLQQSGFSRPDFLEALHMYHPYLMLRALAWSAMAYDSYLSGDKALKNETIFKKVTSYLEPTFLQHALAEQVFANE